MSDENATNPAPSNDQVLYESHPTMFRNHPISYVLCLLALLGGTIGVPVSLQMLEEYSQSAAIASGIVAVIAVVVFLIWKLKTMGTKLTVTRQRSILRLGLLSKHINEISHVNVRNIQIRQSFVERIFSTGLIQISSAGQASIEIEVKGLPDPDRIRELINQHRDV